MIGLIRDLMWFRSLISDQIWQSDGDENVKFPTRSDDTLSTWVVSSRDVSNTRKDCWDNIRLKIIVTWTQSTFTIFEINFDRFWSIKWIFTSYFNFDRTSIRPQWCLVNQLDSTNRETERRLKILSRDNWIDRMRISGILGSITW